MSTVPADLPFRTSGLPVGAHVASTGQPGSDLPERTAAEDRVARAVHAYQDAAWVYRVVGGRQAAQDLAAAEQELSATTGIRCAGRLPE